MVEVLFILIVAAILGLIPAIMAQKKGYSFGLWWAYGGLLFLVAIIHVQFLDDLTDLNVIKKKNSEPIRTVDDIQKQKELLEKGSITQQEFEQKQNQLLGL